MCKNHPDKKHYGKGLCKKCYDKQWRTREYNRKSNIKRYGITPDDFKKLLDSQLGQCAICKYDFQSTSGRSIHIDHDHATGRVRGILCATCNVGLGAFRDDSERLRLAAAYLEKIR